MKTLKNQMNESNMKILPKYLFVLTLLTLRGSRSIWRPPTSLITWSHWGLVSTVVGRVIFRPVLSYESQRSWSAWVRRVRRGGLKSLFPPASKAVSSCFFLLLGMARHQVPEPTPSWTYLALVWAARVPCPGPCGLELSEKTQCRFSGFGIAHGDCLRWKTWAKACLSCLNPGTCSYPSTCRKTLGSRCSLGMRLFAKTLPPHLFSEGRHFPTFSRISDLILSLNFPQKWKIFFKSKDCFVCIIFSFFLLSLIINHWFFWLHQVLAVACGIWFPDQGSNLSPLLWEGRVLATGPPGRSRHYFFHFSLDVKSEKAMAPHSSTLGWKIP